MSNDTKVTTTVVGGALAVVTAFVSGTLGLELPAEVGAAIATLYSAGLGLVIKS